MNKKYISYGVVSLIVVAALSFYAGGVHAKSTSAKTQANFQASAGQAYGAGNNGQTFGGGRGMRGGMGGGFTTGKIISKDATSITVQLESGGSKIVLLGDSTQIAKMANATSTDLAVGTSVSVIGTTNSDGSVTAQSVQIRPNIPAPKQ